MSIQNEARKLFALLELGVTNSVAFMQLYKFIDNSANGRFGWLGLADTPVDGPACDHMISKWYPFLREQLESGNSFSPLAIADLGATLKQIEEVNRISREASRDLIVALRVLDSSFRGVHPAEFLYDNDLDALVALRTRLLQGKPLFELGNYRAFPKPKRLAEPALRGQEYLSDLLDVLTVARTTPHLSVIYEPILEGTLRTVATIGIVPTVHHASELLWSHVGPDRYSIVENDAAQLKIQERLQDALDLLIARGTNVVVLPELVSGPSLDIALAAHLRKSASEGRATPELVLAGSSIAVDGSLRRNRARILNRDGQELWKQDKMHAYCFTSAEQIKAGHPLGKSDVVDRTEHIDVEPRSLVIVDLSPSLRVAVLTCEDFIAHQPHPAAISGMCATLLLVPIMSVGRESHSVQAWITDAAMKFIRHPGATSVVANSAALVDQTRTTTGWWDFGEVRATPRITVTWEGLRLDPNAPPIAWLATLERSV